MRAHRVLLATALLAAPLLAPPLHARAPLPGAPVAAPLAPEPSAGFRAEGLELSLVEGVLELSARELWLDGATSMHGVKVRARVPMDAAFFQAPVSGLLTAFTGAVDVTAATFRSERSNLYALSDLSMKVRDGALELSGKKVATVRATGRLTVDPAARTMTVEVEKIRAGVLPVPHRVAFAMISRVLTAPWVEIARPELRFQLEQFLR